MDRLTREQTIDLLNNGDLLNLAEEANEIRKRRYPDNRCTFIVDRNINYTNICSNECRFCAFYRSEEDRDAYLLSQEEILQKVKETQEAGGTQIMLQGGVHPTLPFSYYTDLLRAIKKAYPEIVIHSFSPTEILHFSKLTGESMEWVLKELQKAGLDSLPGGGAEILADRVRERVSPKKIMTDDWLKVMEIAHGIGMQTTATMVLGLGETVEERVEHMMRIRDLQDKTGGFRAFIIWTFQPGNTKLGGSKFSSWQYLKTLAVARIFFDNIDHIQGSWVTQGEQIGQMTLAFGADDLGSIMLEENVVRAAGTSYDMSTAKMVRTIAQTGRIPMQRDTKYNIIRKFE